MNKGGRDNDRVRKRRTSQKENKKNEHKEKKMKDKKNKSKWKKQKPKKRERNQRKHIQNTLFKTLRSPRQDRHQTRRPQYSAALNRYGIILHVQLQTRSRRLM